MRYTERCGPGPGRLLRLRAGALVMGLAILGLATGPGEAEVAGPALGTTRVVAVEGESVVLGAGRQDGLAESSEVTLLREGESIVHPITGEVLGTPQEPVGTLRLTEVGDRRARGTMTKVYSAPRVNDMAEYERVAPRLAAPAPPSPAVAEVLRKVEELEGNIAQYERRTEDVRTYPEFARRVGDELASMKSYLISMDRRLAEIERQQSEDHYRLTSALSGEYPAEDMKEFTIRYTPDTQVRLRAAGKTLLISVVRDSLRMVEAGAGETAGAAAEPDLDEFMEAPLPEPAAGDTAAAGAPWYKSEWHLAGGVGLLFALLIMITLIIRRRYNDVMEGLDDFDDELLDDEDQDEEEEEEEEED
ncbi:MAG: hypothetical protein ABIL09_11435 [Gemmatimonadota bacterium]